jgi:hypothetical protein
MANHPTAGTLSNKYKRLWMRLFVILAKFSVLSGVAFIQLISCASPAIETFNLQDRSRDSALTHWRSILSIIFEDSPAGTTGLSDSEREERLREYIPINPPPTALDVAHMLHLEWPISCFKWQIRSVRGTKLQSVYRIVTSFRDTCNPEDPKYQTLIVNIHSDGYFLPAQSVFEDSSYTIRNSPLLGQIYLPNEYDFRFTELDSAQSYLDSATRQFGGVGTALSTFVMRSKSDFDSLIGVVPSKVTGWYAALQGDIFLINKLYDRRQLARAACCFLVNSSTLGDAIGLWRAQLYYGDYSSYRGIDSADIEKFEPRSSILYSESSIKLVALLLDEIYRVRNWKGIREFVKLSEENVDPESSISRILEIDKTMLRSLLQAALRRAQSK